MSKKLPSVTSDIPRDLRLFVDRLRDVLGAQGAQKLLTGDDLRRAGLAQLDSQGNLAPADRGELIVTPPAPTNLQASGALRNIILTWDTPRYPGHAYAEVWRSDVDNIGTAVLLALAPGAVYADDVGPSQTKYYWVRFVNVLDTRGPYNSVNGVQGETGPEVAYLLQQLTGQITESQLFGDLGARIDLIDGSSSTAGTIPNQFAFLQGQIDTVLSYPEYDAAETYVENDIVKFGSSLYRATQGTTGNLPTNTTFWVNVGDFSSIADIVAAHTVDIATLITNLSAEVTSRESLAAQLRGSYNGTDITQVAAGLIFSERTARATADSGLASQITTVGAVAAGKNKIFRQITAPTSPAINDIWVDTKVSYAPTYFEQEYGVARHKQFQWSGTEWLDITDTDISDNFASITNERVARASADEAFALDLTTLTAVVDGNTSSISQEVTARTTADQAIATQLTTLQATVEDDIAVAIQQEATVRATQTGELFAKYTVKIDNNGFVSGFGLASTANNATPFSEFIIRADSFSVASPTGPGITPVVPFIVTTTEQTINGVTVPVGVYINGAFIQNGTITNAKIGDAAIDNAKIASLSAEKITAGTISADRIATGSLDAKIANIDAAKITSGFIGTARIQDASISTAKIQDATITSAKIADTLQSTNYAAGTAGWRINKAGTMELNSAVFRGTIDVSSSTTGARLEIKNNVIKVFDEFGVLRVKIGDLSA